jgi:hypothetical protein
MFDAKILVLIVQHQRVTIGDVDVPYMGKRYLSLMRRDPRGKYHRDRRGITGVGGLWNDADPVEHRVNTKYSNGVPAQLCGVAF